MQGSCARISMAGAGWIATSYTTFTLSWLFMKNSSVEFAVCNGWECKQCKWYAVPNVWHFPFNHFLVCPWIACKTAKLFTFFHWSTQRECTLPYVLELLKGNIVDTSRIILCIARWWCFPLVCSFSFFLALHMTCHEKQCVTMVFSISVLPGSACFVPVQMVFLFLGKPCIGVWIPSLNICVSNDFSDKSLHWVPVYSL